MASYKLHLVYFLSEGLPHDNGLNLIHNKVLVEKNASRYVDHIECYTPRIMVSMGLNKYVKDYVQKGLVTHNPGMHRIGNCAWRPKIILMELEKINNGDILIYRDSNITKYGVDILGNYTNIHNIAIKCLDKCRFDFFVPREGSVGIQCHAKTNIIRELGGDHPFTYNFPSCYSGLLTIIRKSAISVELLTEWDNACQVDRWINPQQYGDLHPEFKWSCPEQSILCIIIANWIRKRKYNIPIKYPFIGFHKRNIEQPYIFEDYSYLTYLTGIPVSVLPKRMSLILSGIHYRCNYDHCHSQKKINIDFRHYIHNIQSHIIDFFTNKGYLIDIFICTNTSPILNELKHVYKPVVCTVLDDTENKRVSKICRGFNDVMDYTIENKIEYDLCCQTRFDIFFMEPLIHIDLTKMNIFSVLEEPWAIDDNFILFPSSMMTVLLPIVERCNITNLPYAFHGLGDILNDAFPVNYIKNEYVSVPNLTSFKLHYINPKPQTPHISHIPITPQVSTPKTRVSTPKLQGPIVSTPKLQWPVTMYSKPQGVPSFPIKRNS